MSKFQFTSKEFANFKQIASESVDASFELPMANNSEVKIERAFVSKAGTAWVVLAVTDSDGKLARPMLQFRTFEELIAEDRRKVIVWNDAGTSFTADLNDFRFSSDGNNTGIVHVDDVDQPIELTKKDIIAILKEKGIEHDSKAKKTELEALIPA